MSTLRAGHDPRSLRWTGSAAMIALKRLLARGDHLITHRSDTSGTLLAKLGEPVTTCTATAFMAATAGAMNTYSGSIWQTIRFDPDALCPGPARRV